MLEIELFDRLTVCKQKKTRALTELFEIVLFLLLTVCKQKLYLAKLNCLK